MGNDLRRYLRSYGRFVKNSISAETEYRASFVFKNIAGFLWMVGAIFLIQVLFSQSSDVAGWSRTEVTLLYVAFSIAADLFHVFFRDNFMRFSSLIQKGELDWMLLRPISSRFLVSFMTRGLGLDSTFRLVGGFVLFFYYLPTNTPFGATLAFFTFLLMGLAGVYSVVFFLHTFNIWLVKLDNITHFSQVSFELSRPPLDSWPKAIQYFLVYIIPMGIMTTYAVRALFGRTSILDLALGASIAVILFSLSQIFWNFALRHYSSASS